MKRNTKQSAVLKEGQVRKLFLDEVGCEVQFKIDDTVIVNIEMTFSPFDNATHYDTTIRNLPVFDSGATPRTPLWHDSEYFLRAQRVGSTARSRRYKIFLEKE